MRVRAALLVTRRQAMATLFHLIDNAQTASVVRSAEASGLHLPVVHQNGNLLNPQGQPLKYRSMPHSELTDLLLHHRQQGVAIISSKWDFPAMDAFDDIPDWRFFSKLRYPVARAISNFKMDEVAGWIAPDFEFADYINTDALYRSDNY